MITFGLDTTEEQKRRQWFESWYIYGALLAIVMPFTALVAGYGSSLSSGWWYVTLMVLLAIVMAGIALIHRFGGNSTTNLHKHLREVRQQPLRYLTAIFDEEAEKLTTSDTVQALHSVIRADSDESELHSQFLSSWTPIFNILNVKNAENIEAQIRASARLNAETITILMRNNLHP